VNYNQQYKIVHSDTSDLHQHSVNSEWRRNSQRTPPRGQPSHTNPGLTKPCTDTARDKQKTESRITEYDTWLYTQFPELLMMSEWRSAHVEYYHQIKSTKSCISLVTYMIITWWLFTYCTTLPWLLFGSISHTRILKTYAKLDFFLSLSVTRWSAHYKAVQALQRGYNDILKTLIFIFEARKSKPKTNEIQNVYSKSW